MSHDLPIAVKELIPILVAFVVWGAAWRDHQVTCHCDNQVVVACLSSGTSKHALIMHMLRCLLRPITDSTSSLSISILCTTIWRMTSHVTGSLPFCLRFLRPTEVKRQFLRHSWTSCSIRQQTGSLRPGAIGSALLSRRPSILHP